MDACLATFAGYDSVPTESVPDGLWYTGAVNYSQLPHAGCQSAHPPSETEPLHSSDSAGKSSHYLKQSLHSSDSAGKSSHYLKQSLHSSDSAGKSSHYLKQSLHSSDSAGKSSHYFQQSLHGSVSQLNCPFKHMQKDSSYKILKRMILVS